jgi:hypothetical protein
MAGDSSILAITRERRMISGRVPTTVTSFSLLIGEWLLVIGDWLLVSGVSFIIIYYLLSLFIIISKVKRFD